MIQHLTIKEYFHSVAAFEYQTSCFIYLLNSTRTTINNIVRRTRLRNNRHHACLQS